MDAAIETLQAQLDKTSPAQWIQVFYLGAAGGVLVLQGLPASVRSQLLEYGARKESTVTKNGSSKAKKNKDGNGSSSSSSSMLSWMAKTMQVPHSWFWHFYALSVVSSGFWAWQFLSRGSAMAVLVERQRGSSTSEVTGEELGRVVIAWCMMAIQGFRRLTECMTVMKPGSSPMFAVHWALGLAFYAFMGVAIWIESADVIWAAWSSQTMPQILTGRVPSSLAAFIVASLRQNQCHRHLASLKKYTLPSQGWFQYIVCPHYTAECIIYAVIAFVAAPPSAWFSRTVLTGLVFVLVNLGATAWGTKQWYASKFGKEKVDAKWAMIPFIL